MAGEEAGIYSAYPRMRENLWDRRRKKEEDSLKKTMRLKFMVAIAMCKAERAILESLQPDVHPDISGHYQLLRYVHLKQAISETVSKTEATIFCKGPGIVVCSSSPYYPSKSSAVQAFYPSLMPRHSR